VLHSTISLDGSERDILLKAGPVRCIDVDATFQHIALSGEDKKLKVWRADGLELLSERYDQCTLTFLQLNYDELASCLKSPLKFTLLGTARPSLSQTSLEISSGM
jgi:hypothetical protein